MKKVQAEVDLKSKLRRIPEFKGVVFWDITPILKDKFAFRECIKRLADHYRGKAIDVVVSNEARGFILGAALAYELGVGFVPIR
jgi:adenine phosphoribosyltransferase